MLHTIGPRSHAGDISDLLIACHHRIREHLTLCGRIATAPPSTSSQSLLAAAVQVRRYFGIAFPLHRADEEEDIFPRLIGRTAALDAAIGELIGDHVAHASQIERLLDVCRDIEREPAMARVHAGELIGLVSVLETHLVAHLMLEERMVFPALSMLTADERETITCRMRDRREK